MAEDQAGVLLPRIYLERLRRGVTRTFAYELVDEHDDGRFESGFGLVRRDFSPKPALSAVANTVELVADPGPTFTPAGLDVRVAATTPPARCCWPSGTAAAGWRCGSRPRCGTPKPRPPSTRPMSRSPWSSDRRSPGGAGVAAFVGDRPGGNGHRHRLVGEQNPYGALPQMRLLTYQMPDELLAIASGGEFDEFDLNKFY